VGLIVVTVFFIPADLYQFAINLPFGFEPYRLVVALVTLCWVSALLVDPAVRLSRTAYDKPLLVLITVILGSELVNTGRVAAYGTNVAKSLSFFIGVLLVYYISATILRRRSDVNFVLKLLVFCGGVVGAGAIFEERTGYNAFRHIQSIFPFLQFEGVAGTGEAQVIGGNLRVFASAQHPIALGAFMGMLIPISIYLVRTRGRIWLVATLLLCLGAFSSGSRTFFTMATAEIVIYLILKPKETRRLWPLVFPAIVVVHVFLPGMLGSLRESFFPKGGIVAQQTQAGADYNTQLSGGRLRQLMPMLNEASHHWPLGEGYGTRITGFNTANRNAPILDNEWLDVTLDVGYVGLAVWLWLIIGAIRRNLRMARSSLPESGDDWLFTGFAASFTGMAIGMLTFDAFAFIQVLFLFWLLLGLSAATIFLRQQEEQGEPAGASPPPRVRRLRTS
jgi:hypothetical protein